MLRRTCLAAHASMQHTHCLFSQSFEGWAGCRKTRGKGFGPWKVIDPRKRDVVWAAKAEIGDRLHRADHHLVVGGKQLFRLPRLRVNPAPHLTSSVSPKIRVHDLSRFGREAELLERIMEARHPVPSVFEVLPSRNRRYVIM